MVSATPQPNPCPLVHHYAEIDSTNSEAFRLAEAGAPHLTSVTADFQTAGRGQPGRSWWMPPGEGVLASVLLRRMPEGVAFGDLTLTVGHRLAARLRELTGLPITIKPPNDLLIGGKKFAGVLCEARWKGDEMTAAVIGVGVSVNVREFPEGLRETACSLAMAAGRGFDVGELRGEVVALLRAV